MKSQSVHQLIHTPNCFEKTNRRHAKQYTKVVFRMRYASVSLLESLLQELQQQLTANDAPISAGQVAEAADSERLNVTLPSGVMNCLKQQALKEGRSCSSLATFLIEDGLRRHTILS